MSENNQLNNTTSEEVTKEIECSSRKESNNNKVNFIEHTGGNITSSNHNLSIHEKTKDEKIDLKQDAASSSGSILSSTPYKQPFNFLANTEKNNELYHGAFNNFHNIIDPKNFFINHSKTFMSLSEPNKSYGLTTNTFGKNLVFNKSKNIFQTFGKTFGKMLKSKNFKIHKEEKEVTTFRKSETIDKSTTSASKKIKQNEALFDFLVTASEKLISNGSISMEELESLPCKKKNDFDSETEQLMDDEKLQRTFNKHKARKCENKNCDSKGGPKKNVKQTWVKIKIAKGKSKWLCTVCAKAFKNKQYCFYCISIYKDNNNNFDGKDWICCDFCDSWHHVGCEKIYYNKNIDKYLKQNPDYKYVCPWCRNKDKAKDKLKNKKSKKKFEEEEINEDTSKASVLGKKVRNNYSNDNFEFLDFKPRILRKKVNEIKPVYNHLSNLNLNDNRDIYHDFYKIMNDNNDEHKNK